MVTIVNLRRIEQLEEKTGGTNWVQSLSDAQLFGLILAIESGEIPGVEGAEETSFDLGKTLKDTARRCSNWPDFLDEVLDELQGLGAPQVATILVEAVKASTP
jgi:hypothetical protein